MGAYIVDSEHFQRQILQSNCLKPVCMVDFRYFLLIDYHCGVIEGLEINRNGRKHEIGGLMEASQNLNWKKFYQSIA